jgi:hypothetical protein
LPPPFRDEENAESGSTLTRNEVRQLNPVAVQSPVNLMKWKRSSWRFHLVRTLNPTGERVADPTRLENKRKADTRLLLLVRTEVPS